MIEAIAPENEIEEASMLADSKNIKEDAGLGAGQDQTKYNVHAKECFVAFFTLGSAAIIGFAVYYAIDHAHDTITAEDNDHFLNTTAYGNFLHNCDDKKNAKKDCSDDELIKIFIGCFASALADNICNKIYNAFKEKCDKKEEIAKKPKTPIEELELEPLKGEAKLV